MPTLNIVTNVPCDGVLSSDILKDASKAVSRILSKPESVGTQETVLRSYHWGECTAIAFNTPVPSACVALEDSWHASLAARAFFPFICILYLPVFSPNCAVRDDLLAGFYSHDIRWDGGADRVRGAHLHRRHQPQQQQAAERSHRRAPPVQAQDPTLAFLHKILRRRSTSPSLEPCSYSYESLE